MAVQAIPQAEAAYLEVYGINFSVYIPVNNMIGFQSINYIPWIIYINVTSGNLNSTSCEVAIYDNWQGFFKFTAKESCSLHMYVTGGSITLKKNGVIFNGYTSVSPGQTVTLSWVMTPVYTVTVQNGVYGIASPLGDFFELEGYQMVITATPGSGDYLFSYWQVVGSNRLGQNPYTLTFTKNMIIYPVFKHISGDTINPLLSFILPMVLLIGVAGFTIILAKSRRGP